MERREESSKFKSRNMLFIIFAILVLFLSGMIWLTKAIWDEYRQTIINQQEEQMLLITQTVTDNMSSMIESSSDDLSIFCGIYDLFEQKSGSLRERFDVMSETAGIAVLEKDFVDNFNLIDASGKVVSQVREQTFVKQLLRTKYSDEVMLSIYVDEKGYTFLTLSQQLENGNRLELVIDLMRYYDKLISTLQIGSNGYVLAKTSGGTIIMHPAKEQLGIDVIEGRRAMYHDIDLRDLEEMINKQKKGEEGISVYHSYWWTDESLPRVKKIAAYTPLKLLNDFLIISSVIDYDDIYVPIAEGVVKISVMLLIVFLSVLAMMSALYFILKGKARDQEEIAYLKELNSTLEEMRRSEDRIAHQQRLQIIGTMTSGIAHEFNNLLTPIMGYAGMMLEELSKDDENYQDVQEIYDASEKAKEIIQQISALSRKNMETTFKYITAKHLLTRSLKMVRSICPENITVEEELSLGGQGFLGNETQMNQMILNLCVNGFHAIGREEGKIRIQADVVSAGLIKGKHPSLVPEDIFDSFIRIRVSDTGCGMEPEVVNQIFNPFFTTKQAGQGTGLGLTIVDNILVSHRGLIWVDSKEGEGTLFTICLPINQEADMELPKPETIKGISGVSLLILDNNPKVLRLLERGFKKMNLTIDTCSNTKEVLDMLRMKRYDYLMTDYYMSGTSGLSIAMAARGIWPAIRIIMVTSILRKEIIEAKKDKVIDCYIEKPVACQQILKIMYEIGKKKA